MTITIPADSSYLGLLFRWRGSVWKMLWKKFVIFLLLHYLIQSIYWFVLKDNQKDDFEKLSLLFDELTKRIPIEFILGFYVSCVFGRWQEQSQNLGWPDRFMSLVVGHIRGTSDEVKIIRRTLARLTNLLFVCYWKDMSVKIKRRFPTDKHMQKAGLITDKEWKNWESVDETHGRTFLPYYWIVNLLGDIKERSMLTDDALNALVEELNSFKGNLGTISLHNWIDIPLVYTQVVTLATYGYFFFCVLGRQTMKAAEYASKGEIIQLYFPILTTLEFFFYVGWLTVAESMRFPLGEDDEDFDINYVLDRNVHVTFLFADTIYDQQADLCVDHFSEQEVAVLNHTKGSYHRKDKRSSKLGDLKMSSGDYAIVDNNGNTIPEDLPLVKKRFHLPKMDLKNIDQGLKTAKDEISKTLHYGRDKSPKKGDRPKSTKVISATTINEERKSYF